ncbi:hypothetical protein [Marinagarivorans cellulosilyticus]|uniref:Uncharacterized protein n=1 Tax=Marinagarivorans cellulosilyticus TaxID=2721545 RepID=A0AAN1WHN1_9GAMM|nr:hypothetical protein [Marinagarivorans cellulosilyticus]BCD97751.1 hypothetical protein MARGE09_P1952 [Marinagarivorans cellulosilyticus]
MNNVRRLKSIKWLIYGIIALLTALVISFGIVAPESVKAISAFNANQSLAFVLLRLGLYIGLYVKWKSIVKSFKTDVPEHRIVQSRKSMLSIIVIYEILVGFNIFKLMGA